MSQQTYSQRKSECYDKQQQLGDAFSRLKGAAIPGESALKRNVPENMAGFPPE